MERDVSKYKCHEESRGEYLSSHRMKRSYIDNRSHKTRTNCRRSPSYNSYEYPYTHTDKNYSYRRREKKEDNIEKEEYEGNICSAYRHNMEESAILVCNRIFFAHSARISDNHSSDERFCTCREKKTRHLFYIGMHPSA